MMVRRKQVRHLIWLSAFLVCAGRPEAWAIKRLIRKGRQTLEKGKQRINDFTALKGAKMEMDLSQVAENYERTKTFLDHRFNGNIKETSTYLKAGNFNLPLAKIARSGKAFMVPNIETLDALLDAKVLGKSQRIMVLNGGEGSQGKVVGINKDHHNTGLVINHYSDVERIGLFAEMLGVGHFPVLVQIKNSEDSNRGVKVHSAAKIVHHFHDPASIIEHFHGKPSPIEVKGFMFHGYPDQDFEMRLKEAITKAEELQNAYKIKGVVEIGGSGWLSKLRPSLLEDHPGLTFRARVLSSLTGLKEDVNQAMGTKPAITATRDGRPISVEKLLEGSKYKTHYELFLAAKPIEGDANRVVLQLKK